MHTWFQLGGPAEYFAEPTNADQLIALVRRCHEEDVADAPAGPGIEHPGPRRRRARHGDPPLRPGLLRDPRPQGHDHRRRRGPAGPGRHHGRPRGLAGLETLIGIPGTVGGALHGNAGTHGGNIGQWTIRGHGHHRAGEVLERHRDELVFGYRQSSLDDLVILEPSCELEEDDPRELAQRMQKQWIVRKASQPMGHQCAGCVFKNPRGVGAGELIEQAGLKGTRIGGAVVSDRHANFIVAEPECTSQDVLRLIELVRGQVRDRMGIELELELEIW